MYKRINQKMERIIIDSDPGIDDTCAILLALASDAITVEGITTVEGNGTLEHVTRNALRILSLAGREDVPVFKGCRLPGHDFSVVNEIHGKDAFGDVFEDDINDSSCESEHAVDFIIRTVSENPGEITIAALGPLKNIAQAIVKAPEVMKRVRRLILMGGAIQGGNVTPVAEANIHGDPEAAHIVFSSGIDDILMVGLDATSKFLINADLRELFVHLDDAIAQAIYKISRIYVDFYWESSHIIGFVPHDALVIMYLIDQSIIDTRDYRITVVTEEGPSLGRTIAQDENPNAKVCIDLHYRDAIRLFYKTMFPEESELLDHVFKQMWGK